MKGILRPESSETCWHLAVALAERSRWKAATAAPATADVFQVSTISALAGGVLDGDTPYAEIMRHGDFGLGTFNALDGEMAALDGRYFHLHSDGGITDVDPADLTPFAAVTFFRADADVDVDLPATRSRLLAVIDATLPSEDLLYAIRIDGLFTTVTTRTAKRQSKPYPRLVEATRSQVEHTFTDVRGTVLGFRAPQSAAGLTVAGYHLHFVDDARTVGGHVLDFQLETGKVSLDRDADLHIQLPHGDLGGTDPAGEGIAEEIERAESSR
jgi:acetolactate decarboxylase